MQQYKSKVDLEQRLSADKVIVEIGPGLTRVMPTALTIDMFDAESVDVICNLNEGLAFFPDNSIDEIHSSHVLEHIEKFDFLMAEMMRVLKVGGKVCGTVPHFSNAYFYSDYTHSKFFGLYSFSYFENQKYFKRKVPPFYNTTKYTVNKITLEFMSPFPIRNIIRKAFGYLININNYMKEFYEENWTGWISAYQIRFELEKPA